MRPEEFSLAIEPFRAEVLAHCYRMLGSVHDAEDQVQETYLRAWRAREGYDPSRASLRTWLYRIATNTCLTALRCRSRRPLPSGMVPASEPGAPFVRGEVPWLQPLPDALSDTADPAGKAVDRSSLRLAFTAALQHLSARQRAALVLRDVLSFSAAETAAILETSVAAANSSLQRARTRLRERGFRQDDLREPVAGEQRAKVEQYATAFLAGDVEGLTQLLTDDVLMEMPPMLNWFTGRTGHAVFMTWLFGRSGTDWELRPVTGNGQSGFAAHLRNGDGYDLHTLQLFTVTVDGISRTSVFQDEEVFEIFGLPARLVLDVSG